MARFLGETRVTEKGIALNISYTDHVILDEIYRILPECVDSLANGLDKKEITLRICKNEDEFRDVHKRYLKKALPSSGKEEVDYSVEGRTLGFRPLVRTMYARGLRPDVIFYWPSFKSLPEAAARGALKHDLCHIIEIDRGYSDIIKSSFEDSSEEDLLNPDYSAKCHAVTNIAINVINDMSANEIMIENGFENDLLNLINHHLEVGEKASDDEVKQNNPAWEFYKLWYHIGYPVPFKHRGLDKEYENISGRILALHSKLHKIDGVKETKGLWKLLDKVKNPPEKKAVDDVYRYTIDRMIELDDMV